MRSSRFRLRALSIVTLFAFAFVASSGSFAPVARAASAPSDPTAVPPIELHEVVWGGRHGEMQHAKVPFQNGSILDGANLYRALDRPDLVSAYHTRAAAKFALMGVGLAGLLAGGIATAVTMPHQSCDFVPVNDPLAAPMIACHTTGGGTAHDVALGATLASPLLFVAGMLISTDPVGTAERDRLIDAFNAAHARSEADARSPAQPAVAIGVAPTLSPEGAGLALSGRFY
jgi:hypothetical protein